MRAVIGLIALLLVTSPAEAQVSADAKSGTTPDPASIKVPEITGGHDETIVKDGWKYFYFWRADTSFEQAYADFSDCYRFLPVAGSDIMLPAFVAWRGEEDRHASEPVYNPQYGIVGAAIGALLAGPDERRASQSRMRRCLEPRGYQRFPVDEDTWEQIVDDYSQRSIGIAAKLASGPAPDADPLPETR